jgi:hypothetical protein
MSRKGGAIQSRSDTSSIKSKSSKSSNNETILLKAKTIPIIKYPIKKDPILRRPDVKPPAPHKSNK